MITVFREDVTDLSQSVFRAKVAENAPQTGITKSPPSVGVKNNTTAVLKDADQPGSLTVLTAFLKKFIDQGLPRERLSGYRFHGSFMFLKGLSKQVCLCLKPPGNLFIDLCA